MLICLGFTAYLLAALIGFLRALTPFLNINKFFIEVILWYSAFPVVLGVLFIIYDLHFKVKNKRRIQKKIYSEPNKIQTRSTCGSARPDSKWPGTYYNATIRAFTLSATNKIKVTKRLAYYCNKIHQILYFYHLLIIDYSVQDIWFYISYIYIHSQSYINIP